MQVKELLKKIGALGKTIVKIVAEIQTLAVECVIHAVQHGDVTPATQLVDACGKGIRRQSLVTWFERFGPFEWHDTAFKLNSKKAKEMAKTSEAELREKLEGLKWEEAKAEPKLASVLDCSAAIDSFFNKIHRQIKEGKMEVRNLELLNVVESAAAVWNAKKVLASVNVDTDDDGEQPQQPQLPAQTPASGLIHLLTQQ